MKFKESAKKYVKFLALAFALGLIIALTYKFGAMHSFFRTTLIFSGSEVICEATTETSNTTKYIDGVCTFHYQDPYCMGIRGYPTVKMCQAEPVTFKQKWTAFIMTGRPVISGINPNIIPLPPMEMIKIE